MLAEWVAEDWVRRLVPGDNCGPVLMVWDLAVVYRWSSAVL